MTPRNVCGRCGNDSGAITHETNTCRVHGDSGLFRATPVPRHMCCPGSCELDHEDEIIRSIKMWEHELNRTGSRAYSFFLDDEHAKLAFARKMRLKP